MARGSWLVKPCLMDLLCISPFIRGGTPHLNPSPSCIACTPLLQAGRPLGRPLRCGHKAAKTSHEPLTTNNKKALAVVPPLLPNPGGPPDRLRRGRPVKASRYALRASRSVVVSLSLSRRNAASESEPVMYSVYTTITGGPPFGTAPTVQP